MAATALRLSKCQWTEGQEHGSQEGPQRLIKEGPHTRPAVLDQVIHVLKPVYTPNKHPETGLKCSFSVFSP